MFKFHGDYLTYTILISGIFVTTIYTFKIFFKVFFGPNKLKIKKTDQIEHSDVIIIPLLGLAVPSIVIGFALFDSALFNDFFKSSITDSGRLETIYNDFVRSSLSFTLHSFLTFNFLALVSGLILSYILYYKNYQIPKNVTQKLESIIIYVKREYGFTHLSDVFFPRIFNNLSNMLWKKTDVAFLDNFIVNGIANRIRIFSSSLRLIQTGYIYHYAFTMIIGLLILLLFFYNF